MIKFLKNNLLWQDGKYIAIFIFISGLFSYMFFTFLLIPIISFFLFSLYFFRNPDRNCPEAEHDGSILISPADGKVVEVSTCLSQSFDHPSTSSGRAEEMGRAGGVQRVCEVGHVDEQAVVNSSAFSENGPLGPSRAEDSGRVCEMGRTGTAEQGQAGSGKDFEGYLQKISIFLSPLDVHVNWSPISGKVENVVYRPGKFIVAFAPKSSDLNERNDIIIKREINNSEDSKSKTILVRQIAGFVARRICCWVKQRQDIKAGQKVGMIRYGSRVDILLPANVEIYLKPGQRVLGGQTVLGKWL